MLLRFFNCLLLLTVGLSPALASISPENVVVVANANDKRSVSLAKFYLEKRDIPEANLILLETPTGETINWDQFTSTVLNPLREQLVAGGWVTASLPEGEDSFGRRLILPQRHKIDFLVLCRMPLRISKDAGRLDLEAMGDRIPSQMQTNEASVDSELSLLIAPSTPLTGPLPNPLLGKTPSPALIYGAVVRVARLDGPAGAPEQMIEQGLLAEKIGLRGMAYIDLSQRHPSGDEWLEKTAATLAGLYYPVVVEPQKRIMDWRDRTDAAALYFGWYASLPSGPMREEGFRFPAGALGWHIYSFSASRIRTPRFWTPLFIRSGITGTVGNVYEPYLHLTHRPDLFVEALEQGMSAGEAAYYALPALSWMCLYAGDPLYRPFAVSLDEQLAQIKAAPASPNAQYVVLRQAERLRAQQGGAAALEYLKESAQKVEGLALSYTIASELVRDLRQRQAIGYLDPFLHAESFATADIPLAWQASELFVELRHREQALAILQKILTTDNLSDDAWLQYAPEAIPLSRQYGHLEQADAWEAKVTQITEARAEEARKRAEARAAAKAKAEQAKAEQAKAEQAKAK